MADYFLSYDMEEYSLAICSIISNVQEIENLVNTISKKYEIKNNLPIVIKINKIFNEFQNKSSNFTAKIKHKILTIIEARNLIVHEFYNQKGKCFDGLIIGEKILDDDISKNLYIIYKWSLELIDFFDSLVKEIPIPNAINGTHEF